MFHSMWYIFTDKKYQVFFFLGGCLFSKLIIQQPAPFTHHPDRQLMLEVVILGVKGHFLPLLQLAACEIVKHKHVRMDE